MVAAAVGGGTWVAIDAGRPPDGSGPHQATDPLVEPEVLASVAGRLSVHLEAAAGPVRIGQRTVTVLRYNAGLPGPTLLLHPGDRLAIPARRTSVDFCWRPATARTCR